MNGNKKVEKFLWSNEIEKDFIELKTALTKGGIQAFLDFGQERQQAYKSMREVQGERVRPNAQIYKPLTQKEDVIHPEKREYSLMVLPRTQNPAGFYSEGWNEFQQEEDKRQMPDKWQRISQMVFLEIRGDKRSMKNRPSTWPGGEEYQVVSKLHLADEERDRLFIDDR